MCGVGDHLSSSSWDGCESGGCGCDVAAILSAKIKKINHPIVFAIIFFNWGPTANPQPVIEKKPTEPLP